MAPKLRSWLFPLVVSFVGVLLLSAAWWQRSQTISELQLHFENHVHSVANLIGEATREAGAATALIYELSEEHLRMAAHQFAVQTLRHLPEEDLDLDTALVVSLLVDRQDEPLGDSGPLTTGERSALLSLAKGAPDTLLDQEPLRRYGLICLSHEVGEALSVVCQQAERLDALKAETGLSTLLRRIIRHDILYVALQDATGLLAVAPNAEMISKWASDVELEQALGRGENQPSTRRLTLNTRPLYEGLVPFRLADGSLALLRIGVDGTALETLERNSTQRFAMLSALVGGIVALSFLLTALSRRWRARHIQAEQLLATREEERQHWEMIGQMAATVAHEVRNPLNTLGMVAQRLENEFAIRDDERAEFATMIGLMKAEAARVNRVVTDFLELGRPLVLSLEAFQADLLIPDALGALRFRATSEGKLLQLDLQAGGRLQVDRQRFAQILANLVGNALDAVGPGGEVLVASASQKQEIAITISDNGPGMDEAEIAQVMQPFVSRKASGTGLGLPLVKRFTEAMGGRFALRSTPGQGTQAELCFPAMTRNEEG